MIEENLYMINHVHSTKMKENHQIIWLKIQMLSLNVIPDVPEKNRNDDFGGTELWKMAFWRHNLNNGLTCKVPVQVLRHRNRDGKIFGALNNVAGGGDEAKNVSQIALKYGLCDT